MMEFFSIDNWKVSKYRDITQSLEVVGRRRLCLERVDNEFKKKKKDGQTHAESTTDELNKKRRMNEKKKMKKGF